MTLWRAHVWLGLLVAGVIALPFAWPSAIARTQGTGVTSFEVSGARIDVELDPAAFDLPQAALVAWVETSARAIASYYGRFPVDRVRVSLLARPGKGVVTGRTEALGGAHVRVLLGRASDRADLARDWIMVHELVHLAFPSVPSSHHWIEEGLATYVEPLARLAIGEVPPETVWHDLFDGLPKGLPRAGDRGLDFTPTWGRTYWGGALFCFRAELEIRRRTGNEKGLRDALRGIVDAGGNMGVRWPLRKALEIGDRAVGAPVLVLLYEEMHDKPSPIDLASLFENLGIVRTRGGALELRDDAPLAATRRAIAPEPSAIDTSGDVPRKFPAGG